ncbi:MAG: RNA polymerase [SAR86 cluster bacterium]|uniref:RNA polymerase n=1 Tax=SAR86 cluster bacterium TaxID=2030880 RepID=A0A2A4XDU8_9GAMM|nr:MAG: RNA polymerase [SAR86 cluster bacterium]
MSRSIEPSNTEITDEELMQAVCMGDRTAYQTLVKQHLKSISHYAYRLLGNQKDTEDITQEVFLRLWTNAQKWESKKSKLTTWLHRIAHNLCIDYLRKHGRMQTQDSFDDEADDSTSKEKESIDVKNDEVKLLREAISALPENQRSALSLCHYQGFSNKEAAAIMNISVKALESAIARAKRSLREKLTTSS